MEFSLLVRSSSVFMLILNSCGQPCYKCLQSDDFSSGPGCAMESVPRIPWAPLLSSDRQLDLLGSVGVEVLRKSVCREKQQEVTSLFSLQFEQPKQKYSTVSLHLCFDIFHQEQNAFTHTITFYYFFPLTSY